MKKIKKIITMSLMITMLGFTLGSNLKVSAIQTDYVPRTEDVRYSGPPYYYTQLIDSEMMRITFVNGYTQILVDSQDITPWSYPSGESLIRYTYEYDTY